MVTLLLHLLRLLRSALQCAKALDRQSHHHRTPRLVVRSARRLIGESDDVLAKDREATAAASAAGRRAQRQAIGQTSVEKAASRQFQKTGGQAIHAHIGARGRRQQARLDSR